MTEFKQGDRVRYSGGYAEWNTTEAVGAEGVVTEWGRGSVRVHWEKKSEAGRFPARGVYPENLELVVDVEPKVGDRVRITHEGVITRVDGDEFWLDSDDDRWFTAEGATVEVLERAPKAYAQGTLVRSSHGALAARTEAGHWVWLTSGEKSDVITDESVRRDYSNRIVHEPASA